MSTCWSLIRNEVPPLMSRPSAIFFSGGQIVATLNATSSTARQGSDEPFAQPVIGGEVPPEKNQKHEADEKCECGTHSKCRLSILAVTLSLRCLRDARDGRFFHLELHVIGNFYDHRRIFHISNETVNARTRYDAITGFERTD